MLWLVKLELKGSVQLKSKVKVKVIVIAICNALGDVDPFLNARVTTNKCHNNSSPYVL